MEQFYIFILIFWILAIYEIKQESHQSTRLIYAVWMLSVLILANCYTTLLYSMLTIPEYAPSIDTLEDLETAAKTDSHYILTWSGSSYLSQLIYAEPENHFYYTVGQHINR